MVKSISTLQCYICFFSCCIYGNKVHLLLFPCRISTLGNMSTSWAWSWQSTDTWTAWFVFPVTWHPPYLPRYSVISTNMSLNLLSNSEILWIFARKTTRSTSDFPFTAVPFPSEPHYNICRIKSLLLKISVGSSVFLPSLQFP